MPRQKVKTQKKGCPKEKRDQLESNKHFQQLRFDWKYISNDVDRAEGIAKILSGPMKRGYQSCLASLLGIDEGSIRRLLKISRLSDAEKTQLLNGDSGNSVLQSSKRKLSMAAKNAPAPGPLASVRNPKVENASAPITKQSAEKDGAKSKPSSTEELPSGSETEIDEDGLPEALTNAFFANKPVTKNASTEIHTPRAAPSGKNSSPHLSPVQARNKSAAGSAPDGSEVSPLQGTPKQTTPSIDWGKQHAAEDERRREQREHRLGWTVGIPFKQ